MQASPIPHTESGRFLSIVLSNSNRTGKPLVWVVPAGRVEIFGVGRMRVRVSKSATSLGRVAKMVDPHTHTGHMSSGQDLSCICMYILLVTYITVNVVLCSVVWALPQA